MINGEREGGGLATGRLSQGDSARKKRGGLREGKAVKRAQQQWSRPGRGKVA